MRLFQECYALRNKGINRVTEMCFLGKWFKSGNYRKKYCSLTGFKPRSTKYFHR